jgi:hypothetical protein
MAEIRFNMSNVRNYRSSALRLVANRLANWCATQGRTLSSLTIGDIKKNMKELNVYPRLGALRFDIREGDILTVGAGSLSTERLDQARATYLTGGVFVEDTAAGEATRLKMGSKYLLGPAELVRGLEDENIERAAVTDPAKKLAPLVAPLDWHDLLPITIGNRHKLQYAYDLTNLAASQGLSPSEVLKSQTILTILNEATFTPIIREMVKYNFFGFDPAKMLFMVQPVYPGMELAEGGVRFSPHSSWKLWNHGDITMNSTMDDQIFSVRFNIFGEIERIPLTAEQFGRVLQQASVKISYPIEDLAYLTGSINQPNVGLAIDYSQKGYRMIMEVVGQRVNEPVAAEDLAQGRVTAEELRRCLSEGLVEEISANHYVFKPGTVPDWASPQLRSVWLNSVKAQKGGFWAHDTELGRGVMIESDHGGTIIDNDRKDSLSQIRALNRNFNMFPNPADVWNEVRDKGLMFHFDVKEGLIYLSPPQGDQNFLVPTAFVRRDPMEAIKGLKERSDIPETMDSMARQDAQYGFRELAAAYGLIPNTEGKIVFSRAFIPLLPRLEDAAARSAAPLSFEQVNYTMFLDTLTGRARDHLAAAFEISEVTGSLVRRFDVAPDGKVYLETIPETMKGTGRDYPTAALNRTVATDSKSMIAQGNNKIWVSNRHGYVAIDVPNKQSPTSGEIITYLVRLRTDVPPARVKELFASKIRRVLEHLDDAGLPFEQSVVEDKLLALPLQDLFLHRANKLADILIEQLRA